MYIPLNPSVRSRLLPSYGSYGGFFLCNYITLKHMIRLTQPGALVTIGIMETQGRRTPYIGCDFNFQFQTPPLIIAKPSTPSSSNIEPALPSIGMPWPSHSRRETDAHSYSSMSPCSQKKYSSTPTLDNQHCLPIWTLEFQTWLLMRPRWATDSIKMGRVLCSKEKTGHGTERYAWSSSFISFHFASVLSTLHSIPISS